MTEKDIIKALECCKKDDCDNCPNNFGNCYANLSGHALDLINRLQAEVDRLQKYNTEVAYKHYNDGIKEFAERLKKPNRWRVEDIYYIDTLVKEVVGQH